MRKKVKRLMVLVCAIVMAISTVACGYDEEDAQNYTQALINIICTGKDNTGTEFSDLDESEYEKIHDELIDSSMEGDFNSVEGYNISDESKQAMRDLYEKLYSMVRCDVGTATKNGDDFVVPITIHPLNISGMVDADAVFEDLQKEYNTTNMTEDELLNKYIQVYAQKLGDALDDSPSYGDDYEMNFEIKKGDDGNYSASEDNGKELGQHLYVSE